MKTALWLLGLGFLPSCLLAQTQIGGGTCSSSSLKGNFAVSLTGRQVTAAAIYANVLQANGLVTFDGQSTVTFSLSVNTIKSIAASQSWSGTYTMQANCSGTITITSGGSQTFNLLVYNDENNQGSNFLISGSDATYTYNGGGNTLPNITCSNASASANYVGSLTGFTLGSSGVTGAASGISLAQLDGQGRLLLNGQPVGTYSLNSNCLGAATYTASGLNFTASFIAYAGNAASGATDVYFLTGAPGALALGGSLHALGSQACSASTLTGTYALSFNGRGISSAGATTGYLQANGTAIFDGNGNVTLSGTNNSDQGLGKAFNSTGTYTLASNCSGTISFNGPAEAVSAALVAFNAGKNFAFTDAEKKYVYSASGFNVRPVACGTATLSGPYTYNSTGLTLSGATINGTADESGLLQFDGNGNVTDAYTLYSPGKSTNLTATGTYTVTSGCLATATLMDSANATNTLTLSIQNQYAQGVLMEEASSTFVRTGTLHAAFVNPTQAIGNVASYAVNGTPPGSVFALFGQNLSSKNIGASSVPLPTSLNNTTVTVNGEAAPLFFVGIGQIDAQMPLDIPTGSLANVAVKNGNSTSNSAAVYVPANYPGISVYGNNRAVVVNADGVVNAADAPAKAGTVVVAYFTGGGAVNAAGKLTTGAASPGGLSPVSASSSITVGTAVATAQYIGLTPGGIGLYQANFTVPPSLAKGTYPLVITIGGQASNSASMTVN
jgi:uncharacterized protein (TIGR03437 family)